MKKTARTLLCVIVSLLAILALPGSSTAYTADVTIPIDTVITSGVAAGDQVEVALASSGPLVGRTCDVRSVRRGDGAAHLGNDLIVSSGGDGTTLSDVEREVGAVIEGIAPITLGELITVELVMGPDGEFDGDINIEFDCESVPPADAVAADPTQIPVTGRHTTAGVLLGTVFIALGTAMLLAVRRPARGHTSL